MLLHMGNSTTFLGELRHDHADTPEGVLRHDYVEFGKNVEFTPQGFVKIPVFFTKFGVLEYRRDGKIVRELRPEEEVFSPESIATAQVAPVVVSHRVDEVTPDNVQDHTVGWVVGGVTRHDDKLAGSVIIAARSAIEKIRRRELYALSMGYRITEEQKSGVDPQHGAYDLVQKNIRYNHVALMPPGGGRAGEGSRLRLDTGANSSTRKDTMEEEITINGVRYKVPTQVAQAFRAEQTRKDEADAAQVKELDLMKGKLHEADRQIKQLTDDLKDARDPKRLDERVAEQQKFLDNVVKVAGPDFKAEGTRRQIMEQALASIRKDSTDFSELSDDYVEGMFSLACSNPPRHDSYGQALVNIAGSSTQRNDTSADLYDSAAARKRMREANLKLVEGTK
jgi:uncharacterized protein